MTQQPIFSMLKNAIIKAFKNSAFQNEFSLYIKRIYAECAKSTILSYEPSSNGYTNETRRRPLNQGIGSYDNIQVTFKITSERFIYEVHDVTQPNIPFVKGYIVKPDELLSEWISGIDDNFSFGEIPKAKPVITDLTLPRDKRNESTKFWAAPQYRPYLQEVSKAISSNKCQKDLMNILAKYAAPEIKAVIRKLG